MHDKHTTIEDGGAPKESPHASSIKSRNGHSVVKPRPVPPSANRNPSAPPQGTPSGKPIQEKGPGRKVDSGRTDDGRNAPQSGSETDTDDS